MSKELHLLADEALLLLMANDNQAAFTVLYHRYWEQLLGMAFNRLKDLQAAEDIVHDVFASLWKNRKDLQVESLKSYLAAAIKYMTIALYRKREYNLRYQTDTRHANIPETRMDSQMHYRFILALLHEEVNKLPEKCRVIFKYSRQNGLSSRQIASLLDISPKTVDNQLHKTLSILRFKMRHLIRIFL